MAKKKRINMGLFDLTTKTNKSISIVLALIILISLGVGKLYYDSKNEKELLSVENVDFDLFAGKWYVVKAIPQWDTVGCEDTIMRYFPTTNGMDFFRECYINGNSRTATKGTLITIGTGLNSRLWIKYAYSPKDKFYIIQLANDYRYAVVGSPDRKMLMVLSRTQELKSEDTIVIMKGIKSDGFDTLIIKDVPQTLPEVKDTKKCYSLDEDNNCLLYG